MNIKRCCVYYSNKLGYCIVPEIKAKDVPAWVSIKPIEKIDSNADIQELSSAIQKAFDSIDFAENTTLKDARNNQFWVDLGFKGFGAFSKKYSAVDIEFDGKVVKLVKLIRENQGSYTRSKLNSDIIEIENESDGTFFETASKVMKFNNIFEEKGTLEKHFTTHGRKKITFCIPCDIFEDYGDNGTDAYQVYREVETGNYIAFLIDNGYKELNEFEIQHVWEKQFGVLKSFSYEKTSNNRLCVRASNDHCQVESNIFIFDDEFLELQLFVNGCSNSIIVNEEYNKIVKSIKIDQCGINNTTSSGNGNQSGNSNGGKKCL